MSSIFDLKFLTPKEKELLVKLQIKTFDQLLYLFPFRYENIPDAKMIQDISVGDRVSLAGEIVDIESKQGYGSSIQYTKAILADESEQVEAIWWNMPFIIKSLPIGTKVILTGEIVERKGKMFLNSPKIEKVKKLQINADGTLFEKPKDESLIPVYRAGKNIKSNQIKNIIDKSLHSIEFKNLQSLVPDAVSKKLSLPTRSLALLYKHFPKNEEHVKIANKYLAFEEIFTLQIYRERERILRAEGVAYEIAHTSKYEKDILALLPFKLTKGQTKVLDEIYIDLAKNKPMQRLVEGDVGSGKTALALAAALLVLNTKKKAKSLQVAYIAPTEILAQQHFATFIDILKTERHIGIALLTGSGARVWPSKIPGEDYAQAPKTRVKKLLADGRINIVIGTHTLMQKSIAFEQLALVIIDEQHRFGVRQRMALIEKSKASITTPIPHLLSMSATPIPRTLALTIYGDLDLSILDELPPGRKRAITKVFTVADREQIYEQIRKEIKENKKQCYIIAPRINESDDESKVKTKTSVVEEYKKLSETFKDFNIAILHGKQNKTEKQTVLEKFYAGKIDILIATSVVEVGVSVPNATLMIIENAEHFGLAQLHQLRGRVERSTYISYCYLATTSENEDSVKRLQALEKTSNGFELAEIDMMERGTGSLIGMRQSGMTDIGMEAIKNRKLVEIAKQEAKDTLQNNPTLSNHIPLQQKVIELEFHEE
jgi:ATP-dependent DNA helicase RecG